MITNDDEDWVAVQKKLGDVNLEDFVSVDDDVVTSEIRGVDDMIADHAVAAATAEDDSNDGDECIEENVPTRKEALGAINLLRKYISVVPSCLSSDVTNAYLNRIENVIIHNNSTSTRQSTIKDFFNKK